jgi:hypothetical protein
LAAAAASILLLAGCGARDVPDGPSDAQIEAAARAALDRQWRLSGLEGIVVQPDYVPKPIVTDREWSRLMLECMDHAGISQWGYDEGSGLFIEGAQPTASEQLAFYWCFAEYPKVDLVSDDQLDFIYDYYARWLIPCLESRGFNVMNAPSRKAFADADPAIGPWNPYRALEQYPDTLVAMQDLADQCAPTVAGIAGWSER